MCAGGRAVVDVPGMYVLGSGGTCGGHWVAAHNGWFCIWMYIISYCWVAAHAAHRAAVSAIIADVMSWIDWALQLIARGMLVRLWVIDPRLKMSFALSFTFATPLYMLTFLPPNWRQIWIQYIGRYWIGTGNKYRAGLQAIKSALGIYAQEPGRVNV